MTVCIVVNGEKIQSHAANLSLIRQCPMLSLTIVKHFVYSWQMNIIPKDFCENKNLTCRKCTTVLSIFTHKLPRNAQYSIDTNLRGRPQKNNHLFGIYENIKVGLINYTFLGLI